MTTERAKKSKTLTFRVVTGTIKWLTRVLCRVHDAQLEKVPWKGPLIVITNHINFMEAPLLGTHLLPRPAFGLAKAESWDNPFLRFLWGQWEAIPVKRGEADTSALRQCLEVLERGDIMMIAPEGTRSGHGRLQRAQAGVAFIALRSEAPMIPVAAAKMVHMITVPMAIPPRSLPVHWIIDSNKRDAMPEASSMEPIKTKSGTAANT